MKKYLTRSKSKSQRSLPHFHPIVSIVAVVLGVLGTLFVTHVLAQVTNNTINACVNKKGEIRIVTSSADCRKDETLLSWNQQGIQGPPGPAGTGGEFFYHCAWCELTTYATFFQGKDFINAQIILSNFSGADIHGVIFRNAWLSQNNFNNSNLTGADFSNLLNPPVNEFLNTFQNSNLTNANFSNDVIGPRSDFSHANLQGANFSGTTFDGRPGFAPSPVDLTGAVNGNTANFTNTTWHSTICPDGTNSDNNGNTCVGHM